MTKNEIITAAENSFNHLSQTCWGIDETLLLKQMENKWSAAENVKHLIISTNFTTLAYRLPKFIVRLVAGKPNRPSRSYEELKDKYYQKLAEGATASARFVPKPIEIKYSKQQLIDNWQTSTAGFIKALIKNTTEKDLDNYLARHPLLGRITLRELCYFTIFHTEHHLLAINKISTNQ